MKQVNSIKNQGCTPVSSNCVIYQGPCLDCINVNTGDTVSDVMFELATLLCEVKDQYDLSVLDLDCLVNAGDPERTIEVILQLIIDRLCSLDPTPGPDPDTSEVIVTIASCFQVTDLNGDLVTTMKVSDYAKAIGIKVCSLQSLVNQHTSTLTNHESRIIALESDTPIFILPKVTPTCVLTPGVATDMDIVLDALEDQFCQLRGVTGLPTALSQGIGNQCTALNTTPRLSGAGTMSSVTGWKTNVSTVADSLTNLWLTICDMRTALQAVQTCCSVTCNDILVDYIVTVVDNGATLKIYFSGYSNIPTGFTSCNPAGSVMNISDGLGGSYNLNIDVPTSANSPDPITVTVANTPLSNSGTFTFTLASCLTNGTLTCNKTVHKTASAPQSVCSIPTNVVATIN